MSLFLPNLLIAILLFLNVKLTIVAVRFSAFNIVGDPRQITKPIGHDIIFLSIYIYSFYKKNETTLSRSIKQLLKVLTSKRIDKL